MFATMSARNDMNKAVAEALQDFRFKKIKRDEAIQKISQLKKKKKKISYMSHICWKQSYLRCSRDRGRLWTVKFEKLP